MITTNYQIGQRIWYVDCCAYPVGKSKSVCYYRPIRGVISEVKVKQWLYLRGKRKTNYTVNYYVYFDVKDRNKGYPQQNYKIFAEKKNALEYARLLNKMVDSYDKDDANKTLAKAIREEELSVRAREPIEDQSLFAN